MTLNKLTDWFRPEHTTIAVFGDARLLQHRDGKMELRGGTRADRIAAKEWCSLFLHNSAFDASTRTVYITSPNIIGQRMVSTCQNL